MNAPIVFVHQLAYTIRGTVRRTVVNNKNVKGAFQIHDGFQHLFDVFNLVVCWNYNKASRHETNVAKKPLD